MKILSFFSFIFISLSGFCQSGLVEQYQFNFLALNPAFTGERGNFGVTGILGQQFNGTVRPNQVSQIIAFEGKFKNEHTAIGFQGFRSNLTGIANNGLNVTLADTKVLSSFRISYGINGGFNVVPNLIGNTDFLQRVNAFAGLGVAGFIGNGMISLAMPTVLSKRNNFVSSPNRVQILGGYRFGTYENVGVNTSLLIAPSIGSIKSNLVSFGTKVWFGNKIGIGATIRQIKNDKNSFSKIIPTAEMRVSSTSTIGLSYDPDPLSDLNLSQNTRFNSPVLQLLFRYDVFKENEDSPFLNQF